MEWLWFVSFYIEDFDFLLLPLADSIAIFHQVDSTAVELLDELEGVSKGHYVRSPLSLTCLQSLLVQSSVDEIEAEAYFAAGPLTQGLASAPHIEAYTKKETVNYIRRKDRPQNRTFLEHVHHWIDVQESVTVRVWACLQPLGFLSNRRIWPDRDLRVKIGNRAGEEAMLKARTRWSPSDSHLVLAGARYGCYFQQLP